MFQALFLTLVLGQCSSPTIVITKPPLYISYDLGGMTEVTRCMEVITYDDGRRWRVPIINGYLPAISHTQYANGSERYHFDYRICLTYEHYLVKQRERELARLPGPVEPKLMPTPATLPPPVPTPELEPIPVVPQPTMDIPEPKRRITPSYDR